MFLRKLIFRNNSNSSRQLRQMLLIFSLFAVLSSPWLYAGNYAGDAQVHLIYGENAAKGGFFEFNVSEKSAGVTSPGFMLFIAVLFKLVPPEIVPVAVKATNLLAWYGLLAMIFLSANRMLESKIWAWYSTIISGLIPGSVYNSNIGMENGLFAFFVFLWFYMSLRVHWFTRLGEISGRSELALGTVMGLLCWIRPEGLIVTILAIICRVFFLNFKGLSIKELSKHIILFLVPLISLITLLIYFHFNQTGYLVPHSGLSRILMSNISSDTHLLGPLYISTRLASRLLAYSPLTFIWVLSSILIIMGKIQTIDSNKPSIFLIALFIATFMLYSSFVGSIHIARYITFALPAMVIIAVMGTRWIWERINVSKQWHIRLLLHGSLVGSALLLGLVFVWETNLRLRLDSQYSLFRTMRAPSERSSTSESLYQVLGNPTDIPISLALQEVQVRYWLDDRFIIRSLDGRVDPMLLKFAERDSVNHIGYLKKRRVDFLLDNPSYNRSSTSWSLKDLEYLQTNEYYTTSGVTLTKLSNEPYEYNGGIPPFESPYGPTFVLWFVKHLFKVDHVE